MERGGGISQAGPLTDCRSYWFVVLIPLAGPEESTFVDTCGGGLIVEGAVYNL